MKLENWPVLPSATRHLWQCRSNPRWSQVLQRPPRVQTLRHVYDWKACNPYCTPDMQISERDRSPSTFELIPSNVLLFQNIHSNVLPFDFRFFEYYPTIRFLMGKTQRFTDFTLNILNIWRAFRCISSTTRKCFDAEKEQRNVLLCPVSLFSLHYQTNSRKSKQTNEHMDKHIAAVTGLGKVDRRARYYSKSCFSCAIFEFCLNGMFSNTQRFQVSRLQFDDYAATLWSMRS